MIYIKMGIMPLIGALIGWLTNIIAVKLLFRPIEPIKIPLVNISVQGLLPKRRKEIAKSIGDVIENELISYEDISELILIGDSIGSIKTELKKKIREVIEQKFSGVFMRAFKETAASYIENIIDDNGEEFIMDFLEKASKEIPEKINLSKMVEDKINSFEMEYFEEIIISIARKELRHIETLGAVLGFLIGLVQGAIIVLL